MMMERANDIVTIASRVTGEDGRGQEEEVGVGNGPDACTHTIARALRLYRWRQ